MNLGYTCTLTGRGLPSTDYSSVKEAIIPLIISNNIHLQ